MLDIGARLGTQGQWVEPQIAELQASDLGHKPRLLRIDARAGHGTGKPTTQVIEEAADMWAFAARWTGLEVKDAR